MSKIIGREGIDHHGRKYRYHGDLTKPRLSVTYKAYTQPQKVFLNLLCEKFPNLFNFNNPKPLKIGIRKDLTDKLTEEGIPFNKKVLFKALSRYTAKLPYKKSVVQYKFRFNLDGTESDEIPLQHKKDALHAMKFFMQEFEARKQMTLMNKTKPKTKPKHGCTPRKKR